MDSTDLTILKTLAADGRTTFTDLAAKIGLSGPSTADRVRRLEERGVITGYSASIDPASVGLDLCAFVSLTLSHGADKDAFLTALEAIPEVVECHHVTGEHDYLLKVRCDGTQGLENLISVALKNIGPVDRTHTTVVLSSPIERPLVPFAG
ncbi:MAG: Lrp/AsnC family transcriptional regulator [Coriobacteriia bacterium]|nr:Lrp/AsnC family transcriptional regulator [Coriobacteriia bacterium]